MDLAGKFSRMTVNPSEYDGGKFTNYAKKRQCSAGRPVKLLTNYFRIKMDKMVVYHYNIEITPEIQRDGGDTKKVVRTKKVPKDINFFVFNQLWQTNANVFSSEPVFDGEKNFYVSEKPLNLNHKEQNFKVTIKEGDRDSVFNARVTTPSDSNRIDLAQVNQISTTDFKNIEVQALDIIVKNGPRRAKNNIGFNMFLRTDDLNRLSERERGFICQYLGINKELRYGYYASVRMTEQGLMLNVDRASIVFNRGGRLIDIIDDFMYEKKWQRFGDREKSTIENEIKGLKIIVDHIKYKPKFTIFKFSRDSIERTFFDETRDGRTTRVSVFDYFNREYAEYLHLKKIKLDRSLPCVQVGKDKPKYFPVEVCKVLEDQHFTKKLDPRIQSQVTTAAGQQSVKNRFDEIRRNLDTIITDGNKYLQKFALKIDRDLVEITGRVIDPPRLEYSQEMSPGFGGVWDISRSNLQFRNAAILDDHWAIVNVHVGRGSRIRSDTINEFQRTMIKKGAEVGMRITAPFTKVIEHKHDRRGSIKQLFNDLLRKHRDLLFVLFFLPNEPDVYAEIKSVAELELGIATQCISQEKEKKVTSFQYVSNVLLKINAKLNGINVVWQKNSTPKIIKHCSMVIGLDVTHPSPTEKMNQSIASVVGSMDRNYIRFSTRIAIQPKPKKEIVDLTRLVKELLVEFNQKNNRFPLTVVIYRDGVSEGQFDEVMTKELELLKTAFRELKIDPKVLFLVVQKRNHTRFLNLNPPPSAKNANVVPGTVIDNTIVSNVLYDFYLIPHFGAIGTSRPIHYYVLYDELNAAASDIEQLTYFLSYTYPRCSRSISCPIPVMYAHLSAKRARAHLSFVDDTNYGTGSSDIRQLTASETERLTQKLAVTSNLKDVLYYV